MKLSNKIIILVLVVFLVILSCTCVYLLKENKEIKNNHETNENLNNNQGTNDDSIDDDEPNKDLNNNEETVLPSTEEEVFKIGRNLYEFAHSVGNCKEFKYSNEYPSIIYNYNEIADKFTTDYIDDKKNKNYWNIFGTIEKDANGQYIDMSKCGFGYPSMAKTSLTSFKLIEYRENYITFEAVIDTISTYGENKDSIVRSETSLFKIKKVNGDWKIDYYDFSPITDMLD